MSLIYLFYPSNKLITSVRMNKSIRNTSIYQLPPKCTVIHRDSEDVLQKYSIINYKSNTEIFFSLKYKFIEFKTTRIICYVLKFKFEKKIMLEINDIFMKNCACIEYWRLISLPFVTAINRAVLTKALWIMEETKKRDWVRKE